MVRDSNSGHQLLLPPAKFNYCPIFASRTTQAFVSADTNFSVSKTDVAVFNQGATTPVTSSNVSAYMMGCGWATSKPKPAGRRQ